MKRYYVRYETDKYVCGSNDHLYCYASTLNNAKQIARKCSKEMPAASNVRVYDTEQDDESGHAMVVYRV